MADLLDVLGLSRPVAECAVCLEIYDDQLKGNCSASQLDAVKLRCMQLLQPYVEGYMWQHGPLTLQSSLQQQPPWAAAKKGRRHPHEQPAKRQQAQQQQQQQQQPFLWGVVRYEDSVEDEWFVVWLLLHLTQQLPGCTARCWDDDGEFLLIEAAYSLPRWLKPETASNRVWLRGGQLHIVPPPSDKAPTLPASPTVSEALPVLRSNAVDTRRKKVEAAVRERLQGYPNAAQQQVQRTVAWLPRRLALLLQADPQLVAGATAAFMTRQRDEVQAAAKSRLFPPADMTTALVSLNRCMYAQLMQADFGPPKSYPSPPGGTWLGGDSARQHKAVSMGLKITTGMELMALRLGLQQQQQQQQQPVAPAAVAAPPPAAHVDGQQISEDGELHAAGTGQHQQQPGDTSLPQQHQQQQQHAGAAGLSSNPAWHAYKAVLQRSGYFDGELEGSARYRQLLSAAQEAFVGSEAHTRSSALLAAPKQRLQQLLAAVDAAAAAGAGAGAAAAGVCEGSAAAGQQDPLQQQQQQWPPLAAVLDIEGGGGSGTAAAAAAVKEDGDDWMAAEAEQLQQRLEAAELLAAGHTHKKQQKQQQQGAAAAAAAAGGGDASVAGDEGCVIDAEQLVSGFRGFVQHEAGVEGAEVPAAAAAAAAVSNSNGHSKAQPGSPGSSSSRQHQQLHHHHQQQQQQHDTVRQRQKQKHRGPALAEATGLDFNPEAFLSELMGVLGVIGDPLQQQQQQQQQQTPAEAAALLQQALALQQKVEQQLAAFPGGEAGVPGASSAAAAAAAAGSRSMTAAAAAVAAEGEDSDDYGSSGSSSAGGEGSSFYGSDDGDSGDESDGDGGGDRAGEGGAGEGRGAAGVRTQSGGVGSPVLLEVAPPSSSFSSGAGQPSKQQQQQRQQGGSNGKQKQQQPVSEGEQQQQQQLGSRGWAQQEAWEVLTATDSDDEEDDALSLGGSSDGGSSDGGSNGGGSNEGSLRGAGRTGAGAGGAGGFYDSYSAALEAELAATTMAQTFEKVQLGAPAAAAAAADGKASAGSPAAAAAAAGSGPNGEPVGEGDDAGLTPLDVDYNLVKSLLASYTAQGGLPGPASNLAGLLGLQLGTEEVEGPQPEQ